MASDRHIEKKIIDILLKFDTTPAKFRMLEKKVTRKIRKKYTKFRMKLSIARRLLLKEEVLNLADKFLYHPYQVFGSRYFENWREKLREILYNEKKLDHIYEKWDYKRTYKFPKEV